MSRFRQQRWLLAATLMNFLSIGIMFVAVTRLVREELGGSKSMTGLAATVFFLSAIPTRPLVGRWMDTAGRFRVMVWSAVGLSAITLATGFATSVWMVIALRLVLGVVGSSFYTGAAAMVTDLAPAERRGSALARLSVVVYAGFAVGPLLGEFLFDIEPLVPFVLAACLNLLAALAGLQVGETLVAVGGHDAPHIRIVAALRAVMRPGLVQLCVGFGYASLVSFLTSYSREIGVGASGGLFATFALCTLLVRAVSGPLGDRLGYSKVVLPALSVMAVGFAGLAVAWSTWVPYAAIALVGFGFGGSLPALTALATHRLADSARGVALGAFLSWNDLGNAVGGPFVGWVSDAAGFRWAYGVPAIAAAIGAIIAATLDSSSVSRRERSNAA
jgi:MFS family permease